MQLHVFTDELPLFIDQGSQISKDLIDVQYVMLKGQIERQRERTEGETKRGRKEEGGRKKKEGRGR